VLASYSTTQILRIVISVVLVMFSAVVHEVAHGWAANRLGDPTAKEAGRLTLNPAAHLDPVGSIILPLVMGLMGGPVFAFAKPVPYNPNRLRNPRRDEVLVALAGPASNFLQALLGTAILYVYYHWCVSSIQSGAMLSVDTASWVLVVIETYIYVNLLLMFFNLIPLPPLDGSKVIFLFLSGNARRTYYKIQSYAMPILLVCMFVLPSVIGVDPLGSYLDVTAGWLYNMLVSMV